MLVNIAMGATAGAAGALIGTPAEVALIRMTADGRLPEAERRNYRGVSNALMRITSEEGKMRRATESDVTHFITMSTTPFGTQAFWRCGAALAPPWDGR